MIPVEQREMYAPPSQRGDCWKCCIASILELPHEDVPHFVQLEEDGEIPSYWNETQAFLRSHGYVLASFTLHGAEAPLLKIGQTDIGYHFSAPGHWIASVVSPRTDADGEHLSHAVVMCGSDVAFDPHPRRDEGHLGFTQAFLLVHT